MSFPSQAGPLYPSAFSGWWGPGSSPFWNVSFPGTDVNFQEEAGDLLNSSLVMAVVLWIARNFPEAPIQLLEKQSDGKTKPVIDHAFLDLLEQPNDIYPGEVLWNASAVSLNVDGNAYWRKIRNPRGQVIQLWYIPHDLIEPYWPEDRTDVWIESYRYDMGVRLEEIPPKDVVHLRLGIDPKNQRKGLAPLKSAIREIAGDNVAANFSYALLKNFGVASLFVTPKEGVAIKQEDADKIKADIRRKTTGDRRGEPVVMSAPVDAKQLGFDPDKINVEVLRHMPEHRICALLGVSPMVVGFSSGMGGATFSNVSEAREAAYENNLIPSQRMIAPQLKKQLLSDDLVSGREKAGSLSRLHIGFDLSKVRVLATDEDALHKRAAADLASGGVTVNEYRAAINLQPTPDGDVYLRKNTVTPVSPEMVAKQIESAQAGLDAAMELAKNPPQEDMDNEDGDVPEKTLPDIYLKQTGHRFSTTQFNITGDLAKRMIAYGDSIPMDDLAGGGLEKEPHITILYGIHAETSLEVEGVLEAVSPVTVRFGKLDYFSADGFDVLYIAVRSKEIRSLNRLLRQSVEHTQTHPGYTPHATVAYVKAGLGKKYAGAAFLSNYSATFDIVTFSSRNGARSEIRIGQPKVVAIAA